MTKRFKKVIEGNFVLFYDGDEQIPFDEVVDVLNSLNDENGELKKTLEAVAYEMIDFQRKKLNEELLGVLDDFSSIDDLKKALKKGLVEYD